MEKSPSINNSSTSIKSLVTTAPATDNRRTSSTTTAQTASEGDSNTMQQYLTISRQEDVLSRLSGQMDDAQADNQHDSSIRLKRCKHGRIIIKDLSRKKLAQSSDNGGGGNEITPSKQSNESNNNQIINNRVNTSTDNGLVEHESRQSSKMDRSKLLGARSHEDLNESKPFHSQSKKQSQSQPQHQQPRTPPTRPEKQEPCIKAQTKAPVPTPAPAPAPATPPSNDDDSASSDIYDPEGPILAMSPCDSPPISPISNHDHGKAKLRSANLEENGEDDVPSSAVQLNQQEKYLQKLNRQERVIEEVKVALKPFYQNRTINKEQYKDVLRKAVPKVCHSKNGEINPIKIRALVDAYVKKIKRY